MKYFNRRFKNVNRFWGTRCSIKIGMCFLSKTKVNMKWQLVNCRNCAKPSACIREYYKRAKMTSLFNNWSWSRRRAVVADVVDHAHRSLTMNYCSKVFSGSTRCSPKLMCCHCLIPDFDNTIQSIRKTRLKQRILRRNQVVVTLKKHTNES